jgi:uncharacterized membrane protein YiaA
LNFGNDLLKGKIFDELNMTRSFVQLRRNHADAWGFNLKRENNQYVVDSISNPQIIQSGSLKRNDIIQTVNGVELANIPTHQLKEFFDRIDIANVSYLRPSSSASEIIDLLDDDDEEEEAVDQEEDNNTNNDFDLWSGSEGYEDIENDFINHFSRQYASLTPQRPASLYTPGPRFVGDGSRNAVIDLISDDEETVAPARSAPSAVPVRSQPANPRLHVASLTGHPALPRTEPNAQSRAQSAIVQALLAHNAYQTQAGQTTSSTVRSTNVETSKSAEKSEKPSASTSVKKTMKIKQEFEPKKFGEANVDDEVIEVLPPDEETTEAGSESAAVKRSFGEAFGSGEGDDEIEFIGGNMQTAADMPHPRESCPRHPFSRSKSVPQNKLMCAYCYCYICEVKASECPDWNVHCDAHCKSIEWKKLRDTANVPILRLMAPAEKAAFLAKYRSALNTTSDRYSGNRGYGYGGYDSDDYDEDEDDDDNDYDESSSSNEGFDSSVKGMETILNKETVTPTDYIECSALLFNAIRLVNYSRMERVTGLAVEWMLTANFNAQFQELFKQQISKVEKEYPRLTWLTAAANTFLKLATTPSAALSLPNEFNQLNNKAFLKIISRILNEQSRNFVRSLINRKGVNESFMVELILEYFKSRENKQLYTLLLEYLPQTAYMETFKNSLRVRCLEAGFVQHKSVLLLICEILDSKRVKKSFLADDNTVHCFFALLFTFICEKVKVHEVNEIMNKVINHSAIGVLIENPNLQMKNWAENRFQSLAVDNSGRTEKEIILEEMEVIFIVLVIYLTEYCKRVQFTAGSTTSTVNQTVQLFSDMKSVEEFINGMFPTNFTSCYIMMSNTCYLWSSSQLSDSYNVHFFHFSCIYAKSYFSKGTTQISAEMIKQLNPMILNELTRIPFIEFKNKSSDIQAFNQYHIHLNNRLDNLPQSPTLSQLPTSFSQSVNTEQSEDTKLIVEYPSHEMLLKDLFAPQDSHGKERFYKVIGHMVEIKNIGTVYQLINSLYFSKVHPNLALFLKEHTHLFKLMLKSLVFHFWTITTTKNDSLRRALGDATGQHFFEKIPVKDFFFFRDNNFQKEDVLTFVGLSVVVKTLRKLTEASTVGTTHPNSKKDMLNLCKKTCFEIQQLYSGYIQTFPAETVSSSSSLPILASKLEKDFSRTFFLIYPISGISSQSSTAIGGSDSSLNSLPVNATKTRNILWDFFFKLTLRSYFEMDHSHSILTRLFLDDFTHIQGLASNIGMLAGITVEDFCWLPDELQENIIRVSNAMEPYLDVPLSKTAISAPSSILNTIFNYVSYSKIDKFLQEQALMGFKVVALYNNVPSVPVPSTKDLQLKLALLEKARTIIQFELTRKTFPKAKSGYFVVIFLASLYLGLFTEAKHLVPSLEAHLSSKDGSHGTFFTYPDSDFHNHFYKVLFLNINERNINGAMQLLLQEPTTANKLKEYFLEKPDVKVFSPIISRCKALVKSAPAEHTYLAELLFYYYYNEAYFQIFLNAIKAKYGTDCFHLNERLNGIMDFLEKMKNYTPKATFETKIDRTLLKGGGGYYNSLSTVTTKNDHKEKLRFNAFNHYSILFHFKEPKEYFQIIQREFNQEKAKLLHKFRNDYRYSLYTLLPNATIFRNLEKLFLVLLSRSKHYYQDEMKNEVMKFYLSSFLFLSFHSTLSSKLLLINALSPVYFDNNLERTGDENPSAKQSEYQFMVSFFLIYRRLIQEMCKINGEDGGANKSKTVQKSGETTKEKEGGAFIAVGSSSEPMIIDDNEDTESVIAFDESEISIGKSTSAVPQTVSSTEKESEAQLLAEIQLEFDGLKSKFPDFYTTYSRKMFLSFLFPKNPKFTFSLLLNNQQYELIPLFLQHIEVQYSKGKLDFMKNAEKIAANLELLLSLLEIHHFLPSSANKPRTSSVLPSDFLNEFLNTPDNLPISLFGYFSELQFRYLNESEENYMKDVRAGKAAIGVKLNELKKILRPVIEKFNQKIMSWIGKEPLLELFLRCNLDYFNSLKPFLTSYFLSLKVRNTQTSQQPNSNSQWDLVLTKIIMITNKRISMFSCLDYMEMLFDLQQNLKSLKDCVELFSVTDYFYHYCNNLFLYPLMTILHGSFNDEFSENFYPRGFLSFQHSSEGPLEAISRKLKKIIDRFPIIGVSGMIKGFFVYLIGYLPAELKSYHDFYFMKPNFQEKSSKPALQSLSTSSSGGVGSSASNPVTSSSSFDANDLAAATMDETETEDDKPMNFDTLAAEATAQFSDNSNLEEELIYCVDSPIAGGGKPTADQINPNKRIFGPINGSLMNNILARKQPQSYYPSARSSAGEVQNHPMMKVFVALLTKYSAINSSSSATSFNPAGSGKKTGNKEAEYFQPIVKLIENFNMEMFLSTLKEYYQHEEELFIYILVLLLNVLSRDLKKKEISTSQMISLIIYCQENRYEINATNNLRLKSTAMTIAPPVVSFPHDLIHDIFRKNCEKFFNYFYHCYQNTLDNELPSYPTPADESLMKAKFNTDKLIVNRPMIEMFMLSNPRNQDDYNYRYTTIFTSVIKRKFIFIQLTKTMKKIYNSSGQWNVPVLHSLGHRQLSTDVLNSIVTPAQLLDMFLRLVQLMVEYCKGVTMDKNKKSNLTDIVTFLNVCFQDLCSLDANLRTQFTAKKQQIMNSIKSKKPVMQILEGL